MRIILNKKSEVITRKRTLVKIKSEYPLYIFLLPAILLTFIFAYLPMFSNIIAFMDYDYFKGWMGLGSKFVGFKWFKVIFTDPNFMKLVWRTLYYSILIMIVNFPAPIILALLLNELRNRIYKRVVQTISYLPHFISWVTMASLIYLFLSTDSSGILNNIREFFFQGERIIYMKDPKNFGTVLALSSVYKEIGWGSIIYLAAIASISPELYEACRIDGGNRWQQLRYITFPGILPTTMIMLIFALGGLFGTSFDQVFNLQNPIIQMDTNTINVYTYYTGVRGQQFSIATAIGLFQGAVNCILLLSSDYVSKKITSYGLF